MSSSISSTDSCAITHLRALSIVLILTCHFLQGLGNSLAFAFNVGVQIFLVISGFLYGNKVIVAAPWMKRRMITVYVPYMLFLLMVFPLYGVFHPEEINGYKIVAHFVNIQEYWGGVKGVNHLWYMTAIWICYIFTPIIQYFRDSLSNKHILVGLTTTLLTIDLAFFHSLLYYVFLYALAYYLASYEISLKKLWYILLYVGEAILFTFINKRLGYSLGLPMMLRCFTSVILLIVFLLVFRFFHITKTSVIFRYLSDNSYQLYLVHVPLILGPFSLLYLTQNMLTNILIIFIVVFCWAKALKYLSNSVQYKLQ